MNWRRWLGRRRPPLEPAQQAALQAYGAARAPNLKIPPTAGRMIVVDVETSGLNPYRDQLLAIGAVAVDRGLARLDQAFEIVLRQGRPSGHDNILVHGIGRSAQLAGRDPAWALLDLLNFSARDPLVGFNADFDRIVIERASEHALGISPANAWLDLAVLLPIFFPRHTAGARTLDDWTAVFGIENYARHHAAADALATAQLLLVTLGRASKEGVTSCAQLIGLQRSRRWLAP